MPAGDGTGPLGLGPMTGRAAGYCAGYSVPGYMNFIPGRGGFGRGRRRGWFGRGWRHWCWPTGLPNWAMVAYGLPAFGTWASPYAPSMSAEEELNVLRNQAEFFKQQLDDIQERISTLEKIQAQEKE